MAELPEMVSSMDSISNVKPGPSKEISTVCPSKTTVYLGNINFSLTNNDLTKLLEHCGKIVCTKVAKDRITRRSKGFAFIQFLQPDAAHKCVEEYNNAEVFGRKWSCSIARDNGRTAEFIRKRTYPDKTRCYECGEFGHLSYKCQKNALGAREPPRKKKRRKHKMSSLRCQDGGAKSHQHEDEDDDEGSSASAESDVDTEEIDSLSAAINYERTKVEEEDYKMRVASGMYATTEETTGETQRKRFVADEYFSDEEALLDE